MPGGLLMQTAQVLRPLSCRWVPGADWEPAGGQVGVHTSHVCAHDCAVIHLERNMLPDKI